MPWIGPVVSAVIGAGATAYGASQRPDEEGFRDAGKETAEGIKAYTKYAPQLFALEQQYRPQYNQLELMELERTLLGRPGSTSMEPGRRVRLREGEVAPEGARFVKWDKGDRLYEIPAFEREMPAQRGLLELLESEIAPRGARIEALTTRAQREADIIDVTELAPRAREAFRTASPEGARLLDLLTENSIEELQSGARLDPGLRREVQQSVRGGQTARGFGYGASDLFEEAMETGRFGEQLREARAGRGTRALAATQSFYGDPLMTILGRPATVQPQSYVAQGTGLTGGGPQLFNPMNAYLGNLNASNAALAGDRYSSWQDLMAGTIGGSVGAAGSILGGFYSGGGRFGKGNDLRG